MRIRRPVHRSLLVRALLALALLFAQHTASRHWLAHAVEATQGQPATSESGQGLAAVDHCDQCLTLSPFGAAAPGSAFVWPAALAWQAQALLRTAVPTPAALRLAFRSRAPPILA